MELPTYTNIWRIEKRLYKLYDFRLPMPLPVGQVTAFLAIAVPYALLLKLVGVPFSHTLVWLYLLPPAALAWLATRPVLEGKRLPELVLSQLRYLSEPRVWCRLAPLAEPDEIMVTGRVWRRAAQTADQSEPAGRAAIGVQHDVSRQEEHEDGAAVAPAPQPQRRLAQQPANRKSPGQSPQGSAAAATGQGVAERTPVAPGGGRPPSRAVVSAPVPPAVRQHAAARPAPPSQRLPVPTVPATSVSPAPAPSVGGDRLQVVERALRGHGQRSGWGGNAVLVPGGHRPGRPDQLQRDQARARLELTSPARVVVVGCMAGAGQTMAALLTGQLLAQLRAEPVAVLDLNPGGGSLTERAMSVSRLLPGPPAQPDSGLQVITADDGTERDASRLIDAVADRYPLLLADPAAPSVPRALESADQLVLVTPASADGPRALATTMEWLDSNGHRRLAVRSVVVVNGVSSETARHGDQAASVAKGSCLAIVNVPWDAHAAWDLLADGEAGNGAPARRPGPAGPLSQAAVLAYTALAGVLVTGLARQHELLRSVPT